MGIKGLFTSIVLMLSLLVLPAMAIDKALDYDGLMKVIERVPYHTEEYAVNKFDCSNMSHMLHDWLEMNGIESKIILTYWRDSDNIPRGHAYLLVEDTWYVDAVHKQILDRRWWIKDSNGYEPAVDPRNMVAILDDANVLHWLGINPWEYASEWGYPEDRFFKEEKIDGK